MENLKVSLGPQDTNFINIYMINWKRIKYEVTVVDFFSCQKPKPFLNVEACHETILASIQDSEYKYNSDTDTVDVSIRVMKDRYLQFTLTRSIVEGDVSLA